MKNETFVFMDDIRQKKTTATGAHHKVVKTGCKLPFEYKTRKELKNLMNSPIVSSNPMPMKDFRELSLEDQQRQLDMWGERYGRSSYILAELLNAPQPSASRLLTKNNLNFKGSKSGNLKQKREAFKQVKLLCDAFYGRVGNPAEKPAEAEPVLEVSLPEVEGKFEMVEAKPTARVELANPSRFNFSVNGVFSSKEVQTLLYAIRTASETNEEKNYKLTITLEEA